MHQAQAGELSSGFRLRPAALALLTALAVGSVGCQTTDPYTGEQKTSNATKGAGIGAIGGAIAGALISGKRKAVLIGAGLGALAGGVAGNYMDQQEAKLRAQLEAFFSTGLPTSPLRNADIATITGNFIVAQPVGVVEAGVHHVAEVVTGGTHRWRWPCWCPTGSHSRPRNESLRFPRQRRRTGVAGA